ncbi:hypothetical protein LWI28_000859 [Acer negundo]|uniref:Nodulin-like domain-containing protein n=1 Tax=Acer negundo TaxID=4023 RepID=A0AAD5NR51_ACENE|nr:hypothetical protein LWI28_000859 [Acer negundo]
MLVPEKLKNFLDNIWLVFVCAIWVLGKFVGFLAGGLVEVFPIWSIMLIGVVLNLIGCGLIWLLVTSRLPTLFLWILCVIILAGTNGETCYNTSALVSCVQNFPINRGPIVGILKGFAGLTGAIVKRKCGFKDGIEGSC